MARLLHALWVAVRWLRDRLCEPYTEEDETFWRSAP